MNSADSDWKRVAKFKGAYHDHQESAVGAAAVGGAALGAAAANAAYPYCGYYPYPPCY